MIEKIKIIHIWRSVLLLKNHPDATNLVAWRLDMKVFINLSHLNICRLKCSLPSCKSPCVIKLRLSIVKNTLILGDIVLKKCIMEGVMSICVVMNMLVIRNVKSMLLWYFHWNRAKYMLILGHKRFHLVWKCLWIEWHAEGLLHYNDTFWNIPWWSASSHTKSKCCTL